jgi:DMSO/TMAO reductase YedYZ heme-binding membrane subunit
MPLKKGGWIFLCGLALLLALVTLLGPAFSYSDQLSKFVRLCALYGFVMLAVATAITPFIKEVTVHFGQSFMRVHHALAVMGVVFATLHPVFFAIQRLDILVFLPRFDSWIVFWELAGRPALYIIYVASAAALLRRMFPQYWRYFHALMYVVLIFVIVHANLIGTDFQNLAIMLVLNALFVVAMCALVLKRYFNYQRRKRARARAKPKRQ